MRSSRPALGTDRRAVYDFVAARRGTGATADEAQYGLDLGHRNSASARMTELKNAGLVVPSGKRRETRRGRKADVMVLPEYLPGFRPDPRPIVDVFGGAR